MRHRFYVILPALLLATPALGQTDKDNSAARGASPDQAAKDGKSAAPPAKNGQAANDPPPQTPQDDSLTKYDVTGSSAADAMGAAPP